MKVPDEAALKIDRYIRATRFNVTERIQTELYEHHYFPPLRAIAKNFNILLNLRVAYSATRRAEHVVIDNQRWLVYDQYMGQSMNLLNRIFIEAEDERPAFAYIHKVIAEELLGTGRIREALHCAQIYNSERDCLQPKRLNELQRGVFTEAQERFCLNHELGHQLYRSQHMAFEIVKEHVAALIERNLKTHQEQTAESVIEKYASAHPAASHYQPMDELEREVRKSFTDASHIAYRKQYVEFLKNRDLFEEVFCDILAADLTLADGSDQQVVRAIYIGFYHLQVLSFVGNFFCARGTTKANAFDSFIPVQIRSHCLRSHLLFLLGAQLSATENIPEGEITREVQSVSIQLMNDQKRYYDVIFDMAMKVVGHLRDSERLKQLGEEAIQPLLAKRPSLANEEPGLERDLIVDLAVRHMTGWLTEETLDRTRVPFL